MQVMKWGADRANSDVMSGIPNLRVPGVRRKAWEPAASSNARGKCQLAQSAIKRGTNGRNVSGHAVWSQ